VTTTGAWAQNISFAAAHSFAAGTSPTSVAVGDFNGDNKPDLAVTNQHGVSVLLADGAGGFQLFVQYTYAAASNPQSVAAGNFNADGKLDLAVVNQGSGTVTILMGNGDGSFQVGSTYPAGSNPRRVIVGDFNGDKIADLAIVDSGAAPGTSGVSVLLGNGDGTFQAARFTAAGTTSLSLAMGDFDRDGKVDLAVANTGSDDVSVLLGNGNGTFQPAVNYSLNQPGISVSPTSVTVADFDMDGKLDLAVATPDVKGYAVLLGLGNGAFQVPVHYTLDDPNFVNNNNTLLAVDMNGDNKPDLVLANYSANHVTILLGAGDGTFPNSFSYAAGPEPTFVAVADFNGDSILDLAVSDNTVDGVVTLMLGAGGGGLQAAPLYRSAYIPESLAVGDLNNDGVPDIVAAAPSGGPGVGAGVTMLGNVIEFAGLAAGTFQPPVTWTTTGATSIALGDFNGDGKLDLVSTHPTPGSGNVSVWLGKGDGTFQTPTPFAAGTTPDTVVVADVNGDQKLDLVVGNHNSGNISVLLGNGDGSFQAAVNYATPASGTPDSLVVADFNGDGKPDIAVAISGINATLVALLLGNGNGTFQTPIPMPSGFRSATPLRIASGDFNGDGKFDLAVTDGTTVSILLGNAAGAVPTPTPYILIGAGAGIAGMVAVADFDGDGNSDLAVTTRDGIFLLWGNGNGTFQTGANYEPVLAGTIAIADIDGDSSPDIVIADSSEDAISTDTVAVLRNTRVVAPVPLTVDTIPTGLSFSANVGNAAGGGEFSGCQAAPCTYSATWGSYFQVYAPLTVQPSQGTRYFLDSFSDAGTSVVESSGVNLIHNVLFPATPFTELIKYRQQFQLTVGALPANTGVATPASATYFDAGTKAQIAATPNSGYAFTVWTGNVANIGSPSTTVNMSAPQQVTANFTFVAARCDLTADQQINGIDVQAVIRQALGLDPAVADLNRDGSINVADIGTVVNAALGGPCPRGQPGQSPDDWTGNGLAGALLYDASNGQEYTAVSLGNGAYIYPPNTFATGIDILRGGDFNGDGKSDVLACTSSSGACSVGLGNGDGTFNFQTLSVLAGYNHVELADLNGDGKTDLLLYNSQTGTMNTGIGKGDGTFTFTPVQTVSGWTSVRLADFTGDGKADVLLYNSATGAASVGVSNGSGGFTFQNATWSSGYDTIEIGDLNGDGKADVILYNSTTSDARIGLSGVGGAISLTPVTLGSGLTAIRLGNYRGRRQADVTLYTKSTGAALFGANDGVGNFTFQPLSSWNPGYDNVVAQDVNGDGMTDIILYNSATGTEYSGISNGAGAFTFTFQLWGAGKTLGR